MSGSQFVQEMLCKCEYIWCFAADFTIKIANAITTIKPEMMGNGLIWANFVILVFGTLDNSDSLYVF